MNPTYQAFLEKVAVSPALMQRFLAGRAAQGVGGAAALGRGVAQAAAGGATTSRQVMGQLGGLGKHRLQGVVAGGRDARAAAALPQRLGVAPQHRAFKARADAMSGAIASDPSSVTSPIVGGTALRRGYSPAAQGFMAGEGTLQAAQATTRANPVALSSSGAIPLIPGTGAPAGGTGITAATPRSGIRRKAAA
jgi:hypothetical protein